MTILKRKHLQLVIIAMLFCLGGKAFGRNINPYNIPRNLVMEKDSVLRHVVLFKFKEGTSTDALNAMTTAFSELPGKIPEIKDFEWGLNNSPEGLEKGFTHCFLVTFKSAADRDTYLPHPAH